MNKDIEIIEFAVVSYGFLIHRLCKNYTCGELAKAIKAYYSLDNKVNSEVYNTLMLHKGTRIRRK